jgi:hypothetical protein
MFGRCVLPIRPLALLSLAFRFFSRFVHIFPLASVSAVSMMTGENARAS